MPRKDRSDRIYFLQYSEEYLSNLGILRIMRRHGDKFNVFGMYMYAHGIALKTGGSIAKDPRLSLEEQVAILVHADDNMIDDVRTMLQVCQEYGLIEDDGEAINFTLTEEYTQSYTRQAVDKRRAKRQSQAEPDGAQEEPQAEPEPAKKPKKEAAAATKKHQDGIDVRLMCDGVLSPDAPPDIARWERVKNKYTLTEQAAAEHLYLY